MAARPRLEREPTDRDRHYGDFYGLGEPGSEPGAQPDDRPLLLVHGNCQAEALRVLLDAGPQASHRAVRVPPVHELEPGDVPHLRHLLGRAGVLVVQPVRDDYHQLPLGTRQVVAAAPRARVVAVPVVRHHLLHPHQGLVRAEGAGDPPVVPYHDLRTLARAAGSPLPAATAAGLREVGRLSVEELRRRQRTHETLRVDDLLLRAGERAAHTVNHPGNPVLVGLALRVQEQLGWAQQDRDPGRVLLGDVVAPLEAAVLEANHLDTGAARTRWRVRGQDVAVEQVEQAQTAWYAEHPEVVRAGLLRYADTMAVLSA